MLALQAYTPEADINVEFPGADKLLEDHYGNAVLAFAFTWGDLVKTLTDRTAQGLNAEDVPSSRQKYAKLFLLANALWRSRFLKALTDGHILLNNDRKERAEKLKRREPSGSSRFPTAGVMDTFTGTGEGVLNLCDSAYDAVSGINRSPLSPDIVDKVDRHFPSIHRNWEKRKTVHACIHAEIRIILHLGPPSLHDRHVHPIGWMTSGSHGKPYANWALPGAACSYATGADGRSSVDEAVLKAVSTRLTGALDWLLPGQKSISDELVSSADDGEQERSGYEGCSHHRTVKNNLEHIIIATGGRNSK
ncbi:hypothetical protein D9615_006626 [Tricholomella constricta]|uniref:Uncharacterized protein n=1 Tax=Tricholomella constricta TaxID=117010 RepID=A0A8H5H9X4_9AGAR|nr:hypothetical protein D9615_006626 [Tricholomella constricta]